MAARQSNAASPSPSCVRSGSGTRFITRLLTDAESTSPIAVPAVAIDQRLDDELSDLPRAGRTDRRLHRQFAGAARAAS